MRTRTETLSDSAGRRIKNFPSCATRSIRCRPNPSPTVNTLTFSFVRFHILLVQDRHDRCKGGQCCSNDRRGGPFDRLSSIVLPSHCVRGEGGLRESQGAAIPSRSRATRGNLQWRSGKLPTATRALRRTGGPADPGRLQFSFRAAEN